MVDLIVDVAALGEHREFEMIADEEQQLRGLIGIQTQSLGDPPGYFQTGFGVMFELAALPTSCSSSARYSTCGCSRCWKIFL